MSHYVRKTVASVFAASIALSLTPFIAHANSNDALNEPPAASAPLPDGENRYIVKYDNDVNSEAESQSLEDQGIEVKETLSHTIKASVVVATPDEVATLEESEEVASIELDTRVSAFGATSIWGLDRVDQRTGRDGQYNIGDEGAGVNVYVVDSGLNFSHTDFTGRVPTSWWGIHDGRAANDCSGHGTHVAGSVAGTTYGVAKKANIIPVRVLECDGSGWSSTVMAGIDWAVAHHPAGQPAVMNMSIGGFTNWSFDQTVQSAINDGITVVAAAGNDGLDACGASPARVPAAITVAATNINDAQASWSNYGSCVDIQAPGVFIRSAWTNAPTGYNTMDGTSMASPHVAGAAAVLLSRDRGLSPAQVTQSLINSATTGVVTANKGATPNRLLFIPTLPPHPSCSNLKLGDAWAGVGAHCGLQGSGAATTTPSTAEPGVAAVDAPVPVMKAVESPSSESSPVVEAPVEPSPGTTTPNPSYESGIVPVSAPAPAQLSPAQANVPAQPQAQAPAQHIPAANDTAPEAVVVETEPEKPVAAVAEPVTEIAPTPSEAPVPSATTETPAVVSSPAPSPAPSSSASVSPLDDVIFEDTTETESGKTVGSVSNVGWLIAIGSFLVLAAGATTAYAFKKRKLPTDNSKNS